MIKNWSAATIEKRILARRRRDVIAKQRKEMKEWLFEISGYEGGEFGSFKVTKFRPSKGSYTHSFAPWTKKSVHFVVKIVGLQDDYAPQRNWGAKIGNE